MKIPGPLLIVLLAFALPLAAQGPTSPNAAVTAAPLLRSAHELEQLLAPIALYPDALIALILPACTAPADVVLAARHLRTNPNDFAQVESRSWDDSVKSLTHFPDVLKWLDENLEWTKQVGEAFMADPAEVMNTLQRLRARARAAGTLVDTPQQQILTSAEIIRIVPAQPNVIYVPRYEPGILYYNRPTFYPLPPIGFGVGFAAGSWLAYDCDWVQRKVWVGDRHRHWRGHDWHRPVVAPQPNHPGPDPVRHWQPAPRPATPAVNRPDYARGRNNRAEPNASPGLDFPINPALQPPDYGNLPRETRTGSRREGPGPRAPVASNPPPTHGPIAGRQPIPDSPRNPGTRGRSLPNAIGDGSLTVAPPLRIVSPSLPMDRSAGNLPPPVVAPPLPVTLGPSFQSAAPSLPPVTPSFPEAPAYQSPAPASNNGLDPGERLPRRGSREQLN